MERSPSIHSLDRIRKLCLSFRETSERLSHGAPSFFVREKKQFVTYMDNHHGDGRLALWCAAPPGVQSMLLDRGWIGVHLNTGISWDELAGVIEDAYLTVAPPSLHKTAGPDRLNAGG